MSDTLDGADRGQRQPDETGRSSRGGRWPTSSARTLDLTGTHLACEHGFCGNCNVLLDGETVRSCLMFAVQADGREVETVEALAEPGRRRSAELQQAFHDNHGLQCGFCTPAMLLTAQRVPARRTRTAAPTSDDPRGDQRRHLPLHRLPAHRRVDPGRGRRGMSIEQHPAQDPNRGRRSRAETAAGGRAAGSARA